MQTKTRNILIIISIVVVILLIAGITVGSRFKVVENVAPKQELELGSGGATCGGDLLLPCKPGFICQLVDEKSHSGICIKSALPRPDQIKPNQ